MRDVQPNGIPPEQQEDAWRTYSVSRIISMVDTTPSMHVSVHDLD